MAELLQLLTAAKSLTDQAGSEQVLNQHAECITQHAGIINQHTSELTQLTASVQQHDQAIRLLAATEDATARLVHIELAILVGLVCGITIFAALWGRSMHQRLSRIESRIPAAPPA